MKEYKIPITWKSYKEYTVIAENLQEAASLAVKEFLAKPDENYLSDSYYVDDIIYDNYPKEELDILKIDEYLYQSTKNKQ